MKYYISFKNIRINQGIAKKLNPSDLWCYQKIIKEIKKLPIKVIGLLRENNIKLCVSNKPLNIYYKGHKLNNLSHYYLEQQTIYKFTKDLIEFKTYRNYSLIHHEIGHAIDNIMAKTKGYINVLYLSHAKLDYNYQQRALDIYATMSPHEYFAQGFMSYFQKKINRYKPKVYFEHNKNELKKDKRLYEFISKCL
jgi:hypothetical protein